MPGEWRVMSQDINGRRMYIAGRLRDPTAPLHGGNVEYSGGYTPDRDEVVNRVADLNARGAGSILVLNRAGWISTMPAPHFCPHKDGCPGSDCCEEGDRCAEAAGRRDA